MHENREISCTSWSTDQDRSAKAINRTADMNVQEKSDCAVVPVNQPNNEGQQPSAEAGEGRAQTAENVVPSHMRPTQSGMRKRARTDLRGGRSAMVVPTATVILGPDLFGGQVVSALLYCLGSWETDPLPLVWKSLLTSYPPSGIEVCEPEEAEGDGRPGFPNQGNYVRCRKQSGAQCRAQSGRRGSARFSRFSALPSRVTIPELRPSNL